MLTKSEVITLIRAAKREKKIGWSEIAAAAGGSEIFVASACLGMNSLSEDASRKVVDLLGLPGEAFKEVVQEKFGDGIMSAIDFDMAVERVEHEKGDRVQVVMSGKFLPYKSF